MVAETRPPCNRREIDESIHTSAKKKAQTIVDHQYIDDLETDYWLDFIRLRDDFERDGFEFRDAVNMAFSEMDKQAA